MTTLDITHEKTPDTHSSIVGGSSASRILGCPGSVDLLAKIPEAVLRESSSYADEGTGLHEIMAYMVDNDMDLNTAINDAKIDELWATYSLGDDRWWDAVVPAMNAFNAYLDEIMAEDCAPGEEISIRVESRVEMPGIEGAFGTADILIRTPKRTVVWDWKFGGGVPVYASYKVALDDGTGAADSVYQAEYGNDQLMFYARAAMNTFPDYFGTWESWQPADASDWLVDLVICQPRISDGAPSRFTTDVAALEDFRFDLIDAVAEALTGKGTLAKGSYCRFAKCKTLCPLWGNAPTQMAELGEKLGKLQMRASAGATDLDHLEGAPVTALADGGPTYAEALAAMLDLAEIVEPYINEARSQAHTFMEAGGSVPGHKLVPKRAGWDGWEDEKKTDDFLSRQKLAVDERRKPWSSITPAVARKLLKAKGAGEKTLQLLEKYVKPGVSSGTTLARNDDPREEVLATSTTVKLLAVKIASL